MKKTMALLTCALCVLLLAGCGAGLPEGFEKEDVLAAADETLAVVNTLDYEAMVDALREDLRGEITAEQLEQAWGEKLTELGAFEKITDSAVQGTKGQSGEQYAVAVLACAYENGTAVYTFSYDADYALVGLYMK